MSKHSYLIVNTDCIDISNLPQACVLDRKEFENIHPFGKCKLGLGAACADTAERIKRSPYHRWQEGHKKSIDKLADGITELAYQALALQCIMTCVPACETTGSGEDNRGGRSTKVTSNLGNEIDITPSSNHSTVPKNPGPKGTPNSSVDILDNAGNVATRR